MAEKQLVYRSTDGRVTVYYQPNKRSIARCAVGPELHEAVRDLAENIAKPYAIGISPRRTGAYASSFEVNITSVAMGYPELMTRVAAELANTDPGAGGIEWGKYGAEGHFVLRKTLEMLEGIRSARDAAAEAAHIAATATAGEVG